MSKIVRYFHLRNYGKHNGGVTVKVTGDLNFLGQVDVQYVVCSNKDPYVKKIGRSLADTAPVKIVPLRYLPKELENIGKKHIKHNFDTFDYSVFYFLPKE